MTSFRASGSFKLSDSAQSRTPGRAACPGRPSIRVRWSDRGGNGGGDLQIPIIGP